MTKIGNIFFIIFAFILFFTTNTGVKAALPGARSATVTNDVFLGGDYIELGISKYGSFGTDANKPAEFFGTGARSNIGMSSDLDGFDTGTDWRMDFFMPGTQEERWSIGYKIDGVATTASNARRANTTNITENSVTNQTSGDNLKATSLGTYSSNLEITQVVSFSRADKFFKTVVTLKNISASNSLDSVRYMRSFDPDNTVDKGGGYGTRNTIVNTHVAGDGKAVVSADTSNSASDPVYTGTGGLSGGTRSPIFFYSTDTRARVNHHSGLNPGTVYTAAVYDSVSAKGTQADQDGAISIAFDVGTLTPGESETLTFYTSLDSRDFTEVEEEIEQNEAESALQITDVVATPSATSVGISWSTSVGSSSQIEYGLVPEYGFLTTEVDTAERVTSHQATISDLKSCARYFYRTISKTASNQTANSSQGTFSTTGCSLSSIVSGSEKDITTGSGGTLSFTNDSSTARLDVPANFHTATASFQINKLSSTDTLPPTDKTLISGNLFDLIAVDEEDEKINVFTTPVSFVVEYSDSDVAGYDESSLDVYKYDGGVWIDKNCTLNTTANTLTCNLSSFSVYGVFGQSTTSVPSTTSTPVSNSSGADICNASVPVSAPDLFQIDSGETTVKIYFTPVPSNTKYYISYSTKENAEEHGVEVTLGSEGVQSYTINELLANTIYYFKVRGQNDCMPGPWSNIKASSQIATEVGARPSESAIFSIWTKPELKITDVKTESVPGDTCNYVVVAGDNLWKIAQSHYKDGHKYKQIISDNQSSYPSIAKGVEIGWNLKMICDSDMPITDNADKFNEVKDTDLHDVLVKVINEGQPLAGVEVEIPDSKTHGITNEYGEVLFKSISKGEKIFKIIHKAYAAEQKIKVEGENRQFNVSITVELKKAGLNVPWWFWLIIFILIFFIIFLLKRLKKAEKEPN